MFWIQNNQHEFNSRAAGSTFKEISKANVKSITLTLPPLSEQKRIVDVLAAVDTYIAALQRQAANARAARNAVLHALLTVGGDNWTEVTLGDIATIVPGKYLPKAEYVEDGDYFVYGSNSIMGKYSKFLIEPPHTVMAAIGAYAGAVRYSPLASWVNNNAFGLLVKPSVLPGYFYLWLDLMLDLSTVVAGTGQPYVQRPALRATKLVLPPIVVQHEIVETMTTLDSAIQATDQAIRAATQLRSGLAESLLSGAHEIPETYDHFLGAA
jgi:type I restriction enzyme S subunit